jgi:hypothetical protein
LPYLTIAVAIGVEKKEIDKFIHKFEEAIKVFKKKLIN